MIDITKLQNLVGKRDDLTNQVKQLSEKISSISHEIKVSCTHPTTIQKRSWSEGGYDHRSESTVYEECTICGKRFNAKTTYGGFA